MKILGIDPALSCLGWGIIQLDSPKINYIDSGVIKTKADTALHLRLSNITGIIEQIIDLHKPQAIAMEELDLSQPRYKDQIDCCIRPEEFNLDLLSFFKMAFGE